MLLAIDCSSKTAAAALVDEEGRILAQGFLNAGLTHSETLMPLIAGLIEQTKTSTGRLTRIAVTNGPGSFTGLRIGVAAAIGLGFSWDIPVCGVSSLEAAAWNAAHIGGYIRAVMDARCGQVYTALFYAEKAELKRLSPDEACPVDNIFKEKGILVGDGAEMCYNKYNNDKNPSTNSCHGDFSIAPPHLRYPTGYGVAKAAMSSGDFAAELKINYLRIPQAERERIRRTSP